jgi:hypothetical protein
MGLVASTAEEVVMVEVGDRVRVESEKVGVVTRRGVVTQALLAVFRSRGVGWSAPEAVWYLPVNCGPGRHKMILSPERYRRNLWMSPWHENAAYLPP